MTDAAHNPAPVHIPSGFVLGAATSSYQIEGGADDDGRGRSIWDTFSHTPGATAAGATGDVAADHYHRLEEDLNLIGALGLDAYRFSISWPRIMADGEGRGNPAGLDFYSRLTDGLLERGVQPVATLNHWDLPQALEDRYGGWRGRQTAEAFAIYAEVMGQALGDRVAIWSTHNEPWNNSYSGYGAGAFAPGVRSHAAALQAAHHLNLAHGLGVQALRRTITRPDAQVSVVLNVFRIQPEGPEDADAARRFDAVANRAFTGPMLRGAYPEDLIRDTAHLTDWEFVRPGDVEVCHQDLDLLGINYYEVMHVRAARDITEHPSGGTPFPGSEYVELFRPKAADKTAMGWTIEPRGLEEHLVALGEQFPGLPLMVMENGAAFADTVTSVDGRPVVADLDRVAYLAEHLQATLRARERGADVRGYFVWSLLDNFEWAEGYGPRFGVVRVDYDTLERIPKLSAHWLAELCTRRALPSITAPPLSDSLLAPSRTAS